MKKKWILIVISLILIIVMSSVFVACDDKTKHDDTPSIVFTDDMSADDIIALLPQVENMTRIIVEDTQNVLRVNKTGYINTNNFYNEDDVWEEHTYAVYLYDRTYTMVYVSNQEGSYKDVVTNLSDQMYNDMIEQTFLPPWILEIKKALEGSTEWRVENGKLIVVDEEHEIVYQDFNSTEFNFDYYLSLDIPVYED